MIHSIRVTLKRFFSDNRGAFDATSKTSHLTTAGYICIACGALTAAAVSAETTQETTAAAADTAGDKVVKPTGIAGGKTTKTASVYR